MGAVDAIARVAGGIATGIRTGVRSLAPLDTNPVPAGWDHITKVDPEDAKELPLLYPLYLRHTSAVSVGGSRDVTNRNTEETFRLLRRADVPVFHEPSAPRHITEWTWELSEFTAIPEVLNGDTASLVGKLGAAIENLRGEIVPRMLEDRAPWLPRRLRAPLADFTATWLLERAVFEAYIIQNLDSAAAREANVTEGSLVDPEGAARRALAAEKHLGSEVIYLEYSGTFGGAEAADILAAVDDAVSWSRLWYGGGLDDRENAETVLEAGADAVIVGNVFHGIASEEADLCERAVEELDPYASPREVREWVGDAVEIEETSAARYLATIPGVDGPAATAREYLVATARTRLGLAALAEETAGIATVDELEAFLADRDADSLPGADHLARAIDDADDLARAYALTHLGAELDLPVDELPAEHLSVF